MRTPIKLEGLNYLELDEEPMIAVLPPEIPENEDKKRGISLKELTGCPLNYLPPVRRISDESLWRKKSPAGYFLCLR